MRGEQSRQQSASYRQEEEEEEDEDEEEEEEQRTACIRNGKSGCHIDITDAASAHRLAPATDVALMNQHQPDELTCSSWNSKSFLCSGSCPLTHVNCSPVNRTSSQVGPSSLPQNELRLSQSPALDPEVSFNSSFSFIQQSLSSSRNIGTPLREPEPLIKGRNPPQTKPETVSTEHNVSKQSTVVQLLHTSAPGTQAQREELSLGGRFWRECLWNSKEEASHLSDCDSRSLDIEVTSSLSVDSDTASASSVTSGYDSATPASEGWDSLVKKYEGVLQDCLQNNRTHTKVGTADCCSYQR